MWGVTLWEKAFVKNEKNDLDSGGSEAAVTARTRIGWIKFGECGELLYGRKFSLKMKGRIN